NPYAGLVSRLRASWLTGKTRPMEYRVAQLEALGRFLDEKQQDILEALASDMHEPSFEAEYCNILLCKNELNNTLNKLDTWMKDEHVEKNLVTQLDSAFIRKDPYGVVLIVAPWHCPIFAALVPLIGAIAAGEWELCQSRTLRAPAAGRMVMTAAAKHLTPVTLELGGKNPCYVSDHCELQIAARRVAWGRFFHAGQTCVAPNYVLCSAAVRDKLVGALREAIAEFYGPNPKESPDFARIADDEQFQRLRALLGSGRVAIGGQADERERYIAPTVLVDVQPSDPVMQESILGPILPIITVTGVDEAIDFINARERPLVVYVFSSDKKVVNQVLERTSSGGFCGNDTMMHMTLVSLPFGGIGESGLGRYHGQFTFDTFSHLRGCLQRTTALEAVTALRYPPYGAHKTGLVRAACELKRHGACALL
ncbi:AL3B1 dehydrogenase, partial [Nothocercus nigrocapillus]|nr:AL3B1 dehydrogenase [Nothocercus nigrocapillus]